MEKKSIRKNSGISYSGEVTVKTLFGKRVMSKHTIKNAGTSNLFKFIANALAGNFNNSSRPCQIVLFSSTYIAGEETSPDKPDDESSWVFSSATAISPSVHYSTTAVPKVRDAQAAEVTYTFRIPYSMISKDKIYKMALYSASAADLDLDRCAYIGKLSADGSSWDPITIDDSKSDMILEVDWTMTIENNK